MAHAPVPLHLTHSPTTSNPSPPSFSPTMTSSPSTTGTSPAKATHTCPSCSRSFSRGEHLDRHLTTHMPSNTSKAFVCQSCSKGFTRKDVLTRHIRAVHETKRPDVRKSRRRSCRRCAGFKIKCSGGGRGTGKNGTREGGRAEDPCEACKKRGAVCIYDFGAPVEEAEESPKTSAEDELLDFGSEVSEEDGNGGAHKRRRVGEERYETVFEDGGRRVSPHLLSAARMASESGSQGARSGSGSSASASASAASLKNLISGDHTAELSSADQLMSLMTTNTYGTIPSLDGSQPSSGTQTPQKVPLSVDIPVFGIKPQVPLKSPPSQPAIVPQSPNTSMYRRDEYYQPQKASISATKRPEPLLLSPRDFRDNFSTPATLAKTLQGFPPVSPPSRSPPRHFPNLQASKSVDISSFVNDVPEENQRPQEYPPVSFTVDYTQKQTEMRQNSGTFQTGNLGSLVGQQDMGGNIDMIQLGGSKPEDNHPGYGNDLPGLENDDNWFFDFGIFDTTTDWLRGWGDDSSAQDNTGINGTFSERHLSTVAPPPAGTTAPGRVPSPVLPLSSKPFVSPAAPGSACSDEGSTTYCPKHREDHQTRLPSVSPIKDLSSVEDFLPWGWQSGREEPKRRVTLPPLRQILEEYTAPATSQRADSVPAGKDGGLDERIRTDMVELLSIPYERYPYESADMSRFPPKKMLDGFITLYFEQFHSNLPMIHRPTFSVATCPTIVLVSMASIGASYSNVEGAKVFADTLSELCKRTLAWMAEYNPEYPRSDFYLKALCLQSVYALGSGSHRLYDSADVSRSFLIGNARRIGLFSGTLSPPASSPSSAPNSPGRPHIEDTPLSRDTNEQLEARWNAWRKQEELRRLAWSIFEYDCSFSTLSNRRGAITLNDISTRIPCSEALWEAPNAQAWAALLEPKHSTQLPCVERGTLLFPTLRDVISEKISPDNLTSWGKRLCAQALGRILWDFKEIEESVLSVGGTSTTNGGGLGLPMFGPGLKPAKDTLLKSLMTLCESIQKKQIDGGIRDGEVDGDRVHMILACLISHYTHLHAAFPTISLILSLARRPPSSADTGADPRIARLKTIFSSDPVYARTLAWNSAQIIAISRWKPVFSPVEGMRIFMAGVVLWGFGRYFREPTTATTANSGAPNSPIRGMQEQIVRLDSHPWTRGVQGAGEYCPEEWIRNGGKKATIGNDDPDGNAMTEICSERGAREVLRVVVGILGRMRVWGLGGEFKSVLEEMVRRT